MSELVMDQGGWTATRSPAAYEDGYSPADGRHAFNEDAVLTPIFHALTRGGWRRRQHEPAAPRQADPVDRFRQDPLTAPIPIQAVVPAPSRPMSAPRAGRRSDTGAHALAEAPGRHHRTRERVANLPWR
ncbi:hypothetical protein [Pseudonocardia sp. GCM10023141]|uniref:hypothetical protein n=1 Tax=Pseudonocardia sp. GCM10023141 TaxID=3252653 RepID=UPI00361DDF4A